MSEQAKPERLIAARDGFYDGSRIRAGEWFLFTGTKRPKWAAPAGEAAVLAPVPKARNGDLKPAKARAATRAKTGSYSEAA